MELTGKIIKVFEPKGGTSAKTGKAWNIQNYVLVTEEQYPKHLYFEVFGEEQIKQFNIQEGQTLTVSFDVDAHEYEGKWYPQIRAWKVTPADGAQPAPAPTHADPFADNESDELPFA